MEQSSQESPNHIYGGHTKVQGKTRTRNQREMLTLGNGNIWGRNLDLPQYEMRAYLPRCVVRHPCWTRRIAFSYSDSGMGSVASAPCHFGCCSTSLFRSHDNLNAVLQCRSCYQSSSCIASRVTELYCLKCQSNALLVEVKRRQSVQGCAGR